ncbi:hypothetical protein C8F04DRAFT_1402436 [Mycena alexandri]|uniref:Uncharacterized protein n=1 Tax=Mycena alexandri TaxID=1745969 RepID=A0AAD6S7I5_9AGAR|nr:hypothetical protein C8F04DRAFT_1402436 [Mycena alexandri]
MAPATIPSQPFPIGAAVAAGTVVVVLGLIIAVFEFSMSQKRRQQTPVAAAEDPINRGRTPPSGVAFQLPITELESRADGSTISISLPAEPHDAH